MMWVFLFVSTWQNWLNQDADINSSPMCLFLSHIKQHGQNGLCLASKAAANDAAKQTETILSLRNRTWEL